MKSSPFEPSLGALAERLVYRSFFKTRPHQNGPDSATRDISLTKTLFERLGVVVDSIPCLVVTGSKGKGSTAAFAASVLGSSGRKVGLITSPDLRRFEERIRIDGKCVSRHLLDEIALQIAPAVEAISNDLHSPKYLGPGGVILALAWKCFQREGVDIAVVEAGRGGEFDESSLLRARVSILTPVMLEHPDELGDTVEAIAETKTKIACSGSCLVVSPQTESVTAAVRRTAEQNRISTLFLDEIAHVEACTESRLKPRFNLVIDGKKYLDLEMGLSGPHQPINAAAALVGIRALTGTLPDEQSVRLGLRRLFWPGRLQLLQKDPWVLLDGAINFESAANAAWAAEELPASRVTAVVAVPKPKDLDGVCRAISHLANRLILTEVKTASLFWYDDPEIVASKYLKDIIYQPDLEKAFQLALREVEHSDGIMLLGTQSFLGRALEYWDIDTCDIWSS